MKIVKRKDINELHKTSIELNEIVYLEKEKIYLCFKKNNESFYSCSNDCYLNHIKKCPQKWDEIGCRYGYYFERLNEIEMLILKGSDLND